MKVHLVYFAWVRERIALPKETVETEATTVKSLIAELSARDERYAYAFADMRAIRAAVNQELTDLEAPLTDGCELALFPPMTGG